MGKVKPKVLAFNRYFEPGFRAGGPIRTIINMASHLKSDFDFYIVTTDRDKGDECPYPGIHVDSWNRRGHSQVLYLGKKKLSIRYISRIINQLDPDVIYLNSFFDALFTQRVLWARRFGLIKNVPVVLAPRGEFSEGALQLKGFKKKTYLTLVSFFGLYRGVIWQASSLTELEDIKKNFKEVSLIKVARNLAPSISFNSRGSSSVEWTQKKGAIRLCFLARIVPMKNLDFALRVLCHVRKSVVFTVYGPKEDLGYWELCDSLIKSLPANVHFEYKGEKDPAQVHKAIAQHDLFFLPTRGENYGHVIHEALSSGVPVLISDRTPWSDVNCRNAGWALPLDSEEMFARKIEDLHEHRSSWLPVMRECALKYADEMANDSEVLSSNRQLLWGAINSRFLNTDVSQ